MIIGLPLKGAWFTTVDGSSLHVPGEGPLPGNDPSVDVDVWQSAAGTRAIVSTVQRAATVEFTVIAADLAQVARLEALQGRLLLLRTAQWRRWGFFNGASSTPVVPRLDAVFKSYRVQIKWTDVDRDESV